MLKCLLTLYLLGSLSPSAFGYIPDLEMILDRTAKNQGNTGYVIDLEISFDNKSQTQVVKEHWVIENAESLRVFARGERDLKEQLSLLRIYDKSKKFYMDESGTVRSTRFSGEFFEPLFHIRTVKKLHRALIDLSILPEASTRHKSAPIDVKEPTYDKVPYLRLSRAAGVIAYALGMPPQKDATQLNPEIWIEQDRFVIRKMRLPSQTEIVADDYQKFVGSLSFPQTRTVRWANNSVKIRVINIKNTPVTSKIRELLSPKIFTEEKKKAEKLNVLPEDPIIQEFYSRFR
ncbi:MAG: hypothetical protein SGJ18_06380 [Pseudomonadota bacterium]|nr:hypothetical protein [Pseudomonadota bacterium]